MWLKDGHSRGNPTTGTAVTIHLSTDKLWFDSDTGQSSPLAIRRTDGLSFQADGCYDGTGYSHHPCGAGKPHRGVNPPSLKEQATQVYMEVPAEMTCTGESNRGTVLTKT